MDADRSTRISDHFGPAVGIPPETSLCSTCVEVLQVMGVGISIMSGRNSGPVCSSSEQVRRLEDLQFSLGEGPCHDAYLTGALVSEPDLTSSASGNWPNYAPPALTLGAAAVFAFPLQIGLGTVGALTVYQSRVGVLSDHQHADGRELARILPALLTAIQAESPGPLLSGSLSDADAHRAGVHQASGTTAVQLGIDVHEALLRIRAHAYANSRTVAAVSQDILAHRLRLGDDQSPHLEERHDSTN